VVGDPAALRERLLAAGARPGFAGLMLDRRFDREGELQARDEVLRVRVFRSVEGVEDQHLGWKGPTGVSPEGYKVRRELEYQVRGERASPAELLAALRFTECYRVDRYVEYYELEAAALRLEWYPRMDVLLEVEGDQLSIEAAVRATGLPRNAFTAEPLAEFVVRYTARTGLAAILSQESGAPLPPADARR